jgi:hypothetical protein
MDQIRLFELRGLINKDPVCRGTSVGMSASSRYVFQYRSFKNCRVVVGNLELTYLNCPHLDYSFYQNITEITGYLLVNQIHHPNLTSIPLPNLRLIRGQRLYHDKGASKRNYSVMLEGACTYCTSLGLNKLVEVSRGDVKFAFTSGNVCWDHVNFNELLQSPTTQDVSHISCPAAATSFQCHPSCRSEHCWGPGPNDCQKLTKSGCTSASPCGNRCSDDDTQKCCPSSCSAGCTGRETITCSACKDAEQDGVCVDSCRGVYTTDKHNRRIRVPNPSFKFGTQCIDKCPDFMVRVDESGLCVAECPDDYHELDGRCVYCAPNCPSTCNGFDHEPDVVNVADAIGDAITPITIERFRNCTVVKGSLKFLSSSFTGSTTRYTTSISTR